MKLLLDQNLSHRIVKALSSIYPDTTQVSFIGMSQSSDLEIWEYAKANEYAIVTLDADFHEYSMLHDGPPLVIWLKCGNQPKSVILDKLLRNFEAIAEAKEDLEIWCVEVY